MLKRCLHAILRAIGAIFGFDFQEIFITYNIKFNNIYSHITTYI